MAALINKIVVKGLLAGVVQTRNVYYAQIDASTPESRESMISDYLDGIYSKIELVTGPVATWDGADLFVRSASEWLPVGSMDLDYAGANEGDVLPNLVAATIIGKVTGSKGFGRKFFSGISEAQTTVDALIAGALANMALAALAYVSPVLGDGTDRLDPGLWMKDEAFHTFSTGVVSSLLGTMRRRKPGLGI